MSGPKCVHCGEHDDGNNRTCKKNCTEIKLFGVQIGLASEDGHIIPVAKSPSIRKSKSLDNLQSCNPDYAAAAAESSGYLSDGERKRGKPWSEEEHRSFLEGLEKLGKGDWKGIASKFVTSRKSSQVASHAQKYFNRINLTASHKKRRRASVFDIASKHNAKQPPQGSQSNTVVEESLHIASTASTNVELNVRPSTPAHVATSEKPPLSPMKPSGIPEFCGLICQPRVSSFSKGYPTQTVMASVSWFPVMNLSNQNGVLVHNFRGNFAAVVPRSVDLDTWRQRWFQAGSAPSTTSNEELNLHIRNLALQ